MTLRQLLATVAVSIASIVPHASFAQATRTWVSGVGDDVNPCSRTAPCKTFAGAISKTAADGEINCIDAGGFGTVTVLKSITIDCAGTHGSILNSNTNGIVINAVGARVTLRNLTIDGTGTGINGINILAAASVGIENVHIRGQAGNGINYAPTTAGRLVAHRITVREALNHGIQVVPNGATAVASISDSVLTLNGKTGIRVDDGGTAVLSNSVTTANGTHGATASSTGASHARITLESVVSSGNVNGGVLANGPGAVIWLSNSTLTANEYGFYPPINGGAYISAGNNRTMANLTGNGTPTTTIPQY